MMTDAEKTEIINKFRIFFETDIIENHKKNTKKLKKLSEFNINPFLWHYLANYLTGNSSSESLAKALLYPRVLGTSITTTFGQAMQKFIVKVLNAYGSTTPGIDLEFIDQIDLRKKYCQLKSGPDALNKDDITTIKNHFKNAKRLAQANHLTVNSDDFVFCTLYGENSTMNSFIKILAQDYPVYMGKEFWCRLTGEEEFYQRLIDSIGEVVNEVDMKSLVEEVIEDLSQQIDQVLREE